MIFIISDNYFIVMKVIANSIIHKNKISDIQIEKKIKQLVFTDDLIDLKTQQ